MAKQVIEPQIIEQNQVSSRQEQAENKRANFRFYHTQGSGCLGFIVVAFISVFIAIPLLIFNFFTKKK